MIDPSRRTLLKSMGCGLALASVGATSTAMACTGMKAATTQAANNESLQFVVAERDITVYLQQSKGKERVSLVNLDDVPVRLDNANPVSLAHVNGSLIVKLNSAADGDIILYPAEHLVFEVDAGHDGVMMTAKPNTLVRYVILTSEHYALNGTVMTTA